jgi:4-amino-4-deoxy-L-arabinose transferase-like glycosyltransferase
MTVVQDVQHATGAGSATPQPAPGWNLKWLTPQRCRLILLAVLLLDVVGHANYLRYDCPIDLSGDEAQYWDWSRNLDWSYYSKGPLVAYIIRASCAVFGDTMPGVRYPAIAFGVGTSLVTYFLTRKLFGSERLALGAVLLNHVVPMFVAGSVLMTIDPPMFFCWALATYFAAAAVFDGKRAAWIGVGLAIGVGFLAKYAALLWFVGLFGFFISDAQSRPRLRRPGIYLALVIALLLTFPVIYWNHAHGWVTARHVAKQTGASGGAFSRGNLLEMVGSQVAVIGPVLAVLMGVAINHAIRKRPIRTVAPPQQPQQQQNGEEPKVAWLEDPYRRKLRFLAWIGLSFWGLTLITSLFAKVQVNWPAPAYFTLMILTAYYLGTRLRNKDLWRPWRMWFYGTVALGLLTIPIAHDSSRLFPLVQTTNKLLGTKLNPASVDLLMRLRGWRLLGDHVTRQLRTLGPKSFVLCDDYMQTAETAFYVAGQPKTFYAGSWYTDAKRHTQYDMWPDRRLDNPQLLGRNAVYVGKGGAIPPDIVKAFEKIEQLPEVPVTVRGVTVKTFKTWRCTGFKGMTRPSGPGDY